MTLLIQVFNNDDINLTPLSLEDSSVVHEHDLTDIDPELEYTLDTWKQAFSDVLSVLGKKFWLNADLEASLDEFRDGDTEIGFRLEEEDVEMLHLFCNETMGALDKDIDLKNISAYRDELESILDNVDWDNQVAYISNLEK